MADQDIFENDSTPSAADPAAGGNPDGAGDLADQLLASITNEEGKQKYGSVEEALKGAANAQSHIKTLETELAELKAKGNSTEKLDELLEAVKSKGSGQGDAEANTSTMKPEDVLGIVKDYLTDTEAAKSRQNNIDTVANTFKSRYGKDASEKLYGKAADLGFSKDDINKLIANNPTAALNVLGESAPAAKSADPTAINSGSTANFQQRSEDPHRGNIMNLSKTKDLTDAFAASKQRTLKRLGLAD